MLYSNTAFVPYIIGQLLGRYDDVNDRTSGTLVTTGHSITGYPQSAGATIISGTPMENINLHQYIYSSILKLLIKFNGLISGLQSAVKQMLLRI